MAIILQCRFVSAAGLRTGLRLLNSISPQKAEPLWHLSPRLKTNILDPSTRLALELRPWQPQLTEESCMAGVGGQQPSSQQSCFPGGLLHALVFQHSQPSDEVTPAWSSSSLPLLKSDTQQLGCKVTCSAEILLCRNDVTSLGKADVSASSASSGHNVSCAKPEGICMGATLMASVWSSALLQDEFRSCTFKKKKKKTQNPTDGLSCLNK